MKSVANIKKVSIREDLERSLLKDHKAWLHSYDLSRPSIKLSDKLIIEKYLLYGSPKERKLLIKVFGPAVVKRVWLQDMVNSGMYESLQVDIARELFNIRNAKEYIELHRKEHLQKSLAGSY